MRTERILASYVTFKGLYEEQKYRSPYQILAEFAKYILLTEKLYSFTASDLRSRLKDVFEFDIPTVVLKRAISNIDAVKNIDGTNYSAQLEQISQGAEFQNFKEAAEKENERIIDRLYDFVKEKMKPVFVKEEELTSEFVEFTIDGNSNGKYQEKISEFIVKYKDDTDLQKQLQAIREGTILYTGISLGISELGSIKNELKIFLATEELFSLSGYHGDLYKELAEDFIKIVKEANTKERKISLRFFSDTKDEIDSFFAAAREIVAGKARTRETNAMDAIVNGCGTITEVEEKRADFYYYLRKEYGIVEDEKSDYYGEEDFAANLESRYFKGRDVAEDEELVQSLKYISHINKQRKGKKYTEYTESRAIFVTDTKRTLDLSQTIVSDISKGEERLCGYAINLSQITNILWYKLNRGFGNKNFPKNIDTVCKAQVVLAHIINQKVAAEYDKTKADCKEGKCSEEQIAERLYYLREKKIKPEDINEDNMEDCLDFSEEAYNRFKETIEVNKRKIVEQEGQIKKLTKQTEFANEQYRTQGERLQEAEEKIKLQQSMLDEYHKKEKERDDKKQVRKKRCRFILDIVFVAVVIAGTAMVLARILGEKRAEIISAVSLLEFVIGVWGILKKRYDDLFGKK